MGDYILSKGFAPSMTTHGTFEAAERKLFDKFVENGMGRNVAEAASHSFTLYMLGYVTAEGAAQAIHQSGADIGTARELAEAFQSARRKHLPVAVNE